MAIWRSPSPSIVHIALLSGHAIVIGPEGRDVPPMFESAASAAGCIRELDKPEPKRRGRPPNTAEAADKLPPLTTASTQPDPPHEERKAETETETLLSQGQNSPATPSQE